MTIRHIEVFLAVCDSGCNMTKAAEKLHIAQPAVSTAIKELEDHYGIMLFERLGRRLQITEAGMRLKEYAQSMVELMDDMEGSMKKADSIGPIRIGASMTIGSVLLPDYIKTFSRLIPEVQTHILVAPGDVLEEKLLNNELDIALKEGAVMSPLIDSEPFMTDSLIPVCAADYGFASGQVLGMEEYRRLPYLLREKGSGTRETFDHAAAAAGFSPVPVWEAHSTTALINAAAKGLGVAVLPSRLAAGALLSGKIIPLSFAGMNLTRYFSIIYHRRKHLTSAAIRFIELCRHYEDNYPAIPESGL